MTKQIPNGYKQTKVEIIPEDWAVIELGNIANIYDGTHMTPTYTSEGVPFYSVETITNDEWNVTKFISEEVFEEESKRVKIEHGDILMTRIGDIGTPKFINWHAKASFYVSLALIKNKSKMSFKYLTQYIQSHNFQNELHKRTIHVAFPKKINLGEINHCNIIKPPLKEQEKIADILSTWDDAIAKQEQFIEQKHVFKKGIMQQIFNQSLRFIEFKENWKTVNVGSFMIERNKQIPKNDKYPLMAFAAYKGVTEKGDRYDREFLVTDEETKKYKQTEYGDFIYSSNNLETGSIGLNKYGSATISPVYSIFQIKKSSDYIFISNLLITKKFINSMVRYRQGVMYGQWRIHASDFLKIKVSIPCLEEQTKIANFLTIIDDELTKQTEFLDQLKLQKQSLMQKLLTGQVRAFNYSKESA